jgi:hypothetical protein
VTQKREERKITTAAMEATARNLTSAASGSQGKKRKRGHRGIKAKPWSQLSWKQKLGVEERTAAAAAAPDAPATRIPRDDRGRVIADISEYRPPTPRLTTGAIIEASRSTFGVPCDSPVYGVEGLDSALLLGLKSTASMATAASPKDFAHLSRPPAEAQPAEQISRQQPEVDWDHRDPEGMSTSELVQYVKLLRSRLRIDTGE